MPGNADMIAHANMVCTPVLPLPSLHSDVIPSTSTNLPTVQPLLGRVSAQRQRSGSSAQAMEITL